MAKANTSLAQKHFLRAIIDGDKKAA